MLPLVLRGCCSRDRGVVKGRGRAQTASGAAAAADRGKPENREKPPAAYQPVAAGSRAGESVRGDWGRHQSEAGEDRAHDAGACTVG